MTDEWKPSDKWDINLSARFDRDEFDLTPLSNDPGKNFWYAAAQKEFCYNPQTLQPVIIPQPAQYLRDVTPYVSFDCPVVAGVQSVHPDGQNGHILLTDQFNPTYVQRYFSPRIGMTYTVNPDTVLRFSAGRYAQEPQNYEVQYNSVEPNLAAPLVGFLPFGFTRRCIKSKRSSRTTTISPVRAPFQRHRHVVQADAVLSLRHPAARRKHFHSDAPRRLSGVQFGEPKVNYGVEFQLTKGDFNKNGLSGIFSYTFPTRRRNGRTSKASAVNPVDPYNQYIQTTTRSRRAGGGSPLLQATIGNGTPADCSDQQRHLESVLLHEAARAAR